MSLLVIECGSKSAEPVATLMKRATESHDSSKIRCLAASQEMPVDFEPVSMPVILAITCFEKGVVPFLMISLQDENGTSYVASSPQESGVAGSYWTLTWESNQDPDPGLLDPFLAVDGFHYAALSLEEDLELEGELDDITVDTFPWGHWRLLDAAVKRPDGSWERRGGIGSKSQLKDARR